MGNQNADLKKATHKELVLIYQLFTGKVCEEIGFEKTLALLRESRVQIMSK